MTDIVVSGIHKTYGRGRHTVVAARDVSFTVASGSTLALIGESGSGKSTLGRIVLGAEAPDSGSVTMGARVVTDGRESGSRESSIVLQEPELALNPRLTVGESVIEPLNVHTREIDKRERIERGKVAFDRVHLERDLWTRYPSQLSGGQQQRVGIARAIVLEPRFLVLDEPTASLDLSVRARILDTFAALQQEMGLTYLLITHDMATVSTLAQDVVVLRHGEVVETGPWSRVRRLPSEEYTQRLLTSVLPVHPGARQTKKTTEKDGADDV